MKLNELVNSDKITIQHGVVKHQVSPSIYDDLKDRVTFTLSTMPEHEAPESHFDSKTNIDIVRNRIEKGNEWAWCTVEVRATYGNYKGSDYLGCCSYLSRGDFILNSGYYEDMKTRAFEALVLNVLGTRNAAED